MGPTTMPVAVGPEIRTESGDLVLTVDDGAKVRIATRGNAADSEVATVAQLDTFRSEMIGLFASLERKNEEARQNATMALERQAELATLAQQRAEQLADQRFQSLQRTVNSVVVNLTAVIDTLIGPGGTPVVEVPTGDELPPCTSETQTSIISIHDASLGMDKLLVCTTADSKSTWEAVLTLNGIVSDGPDPLAFAAAIGSGMPGVYVLRADADDGYSTNTIQVPDLKVFPQQDVRIISSGVVGEIFLEFGYIEISAYGEIMVVGHVAQVNCKQSIALDDLELAKFELADSVTLVKLGGIDFTTKRREYLQSNEPLGGWGALKPMLFDGLKGGVDMFDSRQGSKGGTQVVTGRQGSTFTLFLLAAETFDHSASGANKYKARCESVGLRTVGSGHSASYCSQCAGYNCFCLPYNYDPNNQYWGSTTDVDDFTRQAGKYGRPSRVFEINWDQIVIHSYSNGYAFNYPGDTGGWETPKHSVCAGVH